MVLVHGLDDGMLTELWTVPIRETLTEIDSLVPYGQWGEFLPDCWFVESNKTRCSTHDVSKVVIHT
jgi:hypothetical protein